jgi:hypothetical protein
MLWWLRRFKKPDLRTPEERRADFLALPFNSPAHDEAAGLGDSESEHALEAICDGNQVEADKTAWEALLAALDEALSDADCGEVDGVRDEGDDEASVICYGPDANAMFTATESLLRAYKPCLRVELRYGEPDDEDADVRVISVHG